MKFVNTGFGLQRYKAGVPSLLEKKVEQSFTKAWGGGVIFHAGLESLHPTYTNPSTCIGDENGVECRRPSHLQPTPPTFYDQHFKARLNSKLAGLSLPLRGAKGARLLCFA